MLSLGIPYSPDAAKGYAEGFTPHRLLYELGPGWDASRTPGRLNTLTSLGLALLAAAGLSLVLRQAARLRVFRSPSARAKVVCATGAAFAGLILLEGFGSTAHPRVPPVPSGQIGAAAPQFHLPSDDFVDGGFYSYWSIDGFPKLVNGGGSIQPALLQRIREVTAPFPDASSVAFLRRLGVRTVILHLDLATGTPWQDAAGRSTTGLPLTRENSGNLVIYRLKPGSLP